MMDLRVILGELEQFWDGRDMAPLHHALYVHEFGETSVLAERDRRIDGYLLGLLNQHRVGYVHVAAVRREARGDGLARRLYERFAQLVADRGAVALKAITDPENAGSRAFHSALGFTAEEVGGYSASGASRLVLRRAVKARR